MIGRFAVTEATSKVVRTMCPMSCHPTLCGMLAEVRGGRLVGVNGDEANPDSRGFLCIRGRCGPQQLDQTDQTHAGAGLYSVAFTMSTIWRR